MRGELPECRGGARLVLPHTASARERYFLEERYYEVSVPIRAMPFEAIDDAVIESLANLRVREDRTLDFKRALNLGSSEDQSEFLKDVTAFANGSGGTLLYGVSEGNGENEGLIVGFPGLELPQPDSTHQLIDNLLRSSVDERIIGVLHRSVPRKDGRYYYLVRVPPSQLAPHMVMHGRHKYKCFLRANTTTDTMDARQIKETALRAASAIDRALSIVEDRRRLLIARAHRAPEEGGLADHPTDDTSQLLLHIVPLFPTPGGFAISDDRIVQRLAAVSPLGYSTGNLERRFTLEGLYLQAYTIRAAYLRSGAAEFVESGIAEAPHLRRGHAEPSPRILRAWQIAQDVLTTLDQCAGLTGAGLLPLPVALGIALSDVRGARLEWHPRGSRVTPEESEADVVALTPVVLHNWDAAASEQVRGLFDEMHQSWGLQRDPNYRDGQRLWWGDRDRIAAPLPLFWAEGWQSS